MLLHHCLHITQTEPKTFHVVYISGGDTIEFVKNLAKVFTWDANAEIDKGNMQ